MQDQKVKFGLISYWSLSSSDINRLRDSFEKLELVSFIPEQTTPLVALRSAMEQVFKGKLIRRLKHKGFVAVTEQRGDVENEYQNEASIAIDESDGESLIMGPNVSTDDADSVRTAYREARMILTPAAGGAMLSKLVVERMQGTTLRPSGGIYWMPGEALAKWREVAAAVEAAAVVRGNETRSSVFLVSHELNEESIRAVASAIQQEAEQEAERIKRDLTSGIGTRAMETRVRDSNALQEKLQRYRQILDVSTRQLSTNVEDLSVETARAVIDDMTFEETNV